MKRRGIALPTVLIMSSLVLIFIGVLFFYVRSQRVVQPRVYDQTKALALAKGVMQLALYKVKVLPSEFYRANSLVQSTQTNLNDLNNPITLYFKNWLYDFDDQIATSPVRRLIDTIPDSNVVKYRAGVETFTIQRRKDLGYKRDLVRIVTWGVCGEERKTVESLVEIEIPNP